MTSDQDGSEEKQPGTKAEAQDTSAAQGKKKRPRRRRVRKALRRFFHPPEGSRFWRRHLPWVTVVVVIVGVIIGAAHLWAWTNSPKFCGELCHTMPPEYAAYQVSPHSRVSCVECHIGREFIGKQLPRKLVHSKLIFATLFKTYEYPIYATSMRPARDACETCHSPDKFSDDSLRVNTHYLADEANTRYSISLIMKTGGGTKREGLGRGIHWHVQNKVEYLSTDSLDQTIPYVRVTDDDGAVTEYVDVDSDLDISSIDLESLETMDCITCHNRVSHSISQPVRAIEASMSRGVISADLPHIRELGVSVLTTEYEDQEQAAIEIAQAVEDYYRMTYPSVHADQQTEIEAAIAEIQRIYSVSVFKEQEIDWDTHPNNVGHMEAPGCFRCHDGKHLDDRTNAIRLECNICHSIPVVTDSDDLVTDIEIVQGPEPASHLHASWINLHNQRYDESCAECHTTEDAGGTSDTSFCSNSACHGIAYTYAGFNAPALRELLRLEPTSSPVTGSPDSGADEE